MNNAHIKLLKENYEKACEEYLKAFCNAYEIPYENDSWVADDVGTIACVGDYYFDFTDVIKYAVDNNLSDRHELLQWYDYVLFAIEYNQNQPNLKAWVSGCPRLSEEQQRQLVDKKTEFENLMHSLKERF